MTVRGLERIRFTVPVGDRVVVAVTQDLRIVVAVPDGQAEVDVDELTAALAEAEAYAAAARRVGPRAVRLDCHWPDCIASGSCDYQGHRCGEQARQLVAGRVIGAAR